MVQVTDCPEVLVGFQVLGFLQCIRALNGIHIPVTCLPWADFPYCSCQDFHSIVLQAVGTTKGPSSTSALAGLAALMTPGFSGTPPSQPCWRAFVLYQKSWTYSWAM